MRHWRGVKSGNRGLKSQNFPVNSLLLYAIDRKIVYLRHKINTPQALDFESEYMGHCICQGAYDSGITNGDIKIYSIRDGDGDPHVTLEVRGQDIYQCKGKGNKIPVRRYIPAVQHFIEAQKLGIKHDMKNIGLIKQDGKYYSIYDFPNGFVVRGDLDLGYMDLSDVNLNIKVTCDLNLYNATNIKLLPKTDFCGAKGIVLSCVDLSGVREIKWPTEFVCLEYCTNLPPKMDFSTTKKVDLKDTDLSSVRKIKWPDNGQVIGLDKDMLSKHLQKSYDLWRAKKLIKNAVKKIIQPDVPNRATSNEY